MAGIPLKSDDSIEYDCSDADGNTYKILHSGRVFVCDKYPDFRVQDIGNGSFLLYHPLNVHGMRLLHSVKEKPLELQTE